jgi:MoaA/NifB/PqqE/SkfB family radical SAM enzyme
MMPNNVHQLEGIVELASRLGAGQVNFKQCDVIRGHRGEGLGLFRGRADRETRAMERKLEQARKLARRLGLETTAFSFSPDEKPVCEQDPRDSLFVRWDGQVAPCINQAYGGPTCFFGKQTEMPTVHYGNLLESEPDELWQASTCRRYRETFAERVTAYEREFVSELLGGGFDRLSRANAKASEAMVEPPQGCEICHYLYNV